VERLRELKACAREHWVCAVLVLAGFVLIAGLPAVAAGLLHVWRQWRCCSRGSKYAQVVSAQPLMMGPMSPDLRAP